MNLQEMAHLSAVVQLFVVVVSIVFIWRQLRQGIQLRKAANAQALAEHAAHFNALLIQDPDVARIWYTYGWGLDVDRFKEIAAAERYQELLVQWLILHENIYYQHRKGLLDADLYNSWAADLERTVAKHNLQAVSPSVDEIFTGGFGRYLMHLAQKGGPADAPKSRS